MDMSGMSGMSMPSSTMMNMATTATGAAAPATTSAAMDMGMDMGGGCKISMLWNWYTVDSCFIASTWHITSSGMFAGSCIGVILLVMSLEFLRRLGKEYDRYILKQYQLANATAVTAIHASAGKGDSKEGSSHNGSEERVTPPLSTFRPNLFQQAIRATLHMVQFAVAYFIMLLAMYFNGYIIISIIIGAWLGAFIFSWETINFGGHKEEVTFCCG